MYTFIINARTGNNRHNEFAQVSVLKVYVKFSDEPSGLKAMTSSNFG